MSLDSSKATCFRLMEQAAKQDIYQLSSEKFFLHSKLRKNHKRGRKREKIKRRSSWVSAKKAKSKEKKLRFSFNRKICVSVYVCCLIHLSGAIWVYVWFGKYFFSCLLAQNTRAEKKCKKNQPLADWQIFSVCALHLRCYAWSLYKI